MLFIWGIVILSMVLLSACGQADSKQKTIDKQQSKLVGEWVSAPHLKLNIFEDNTFQLISFNKQYTGKWMALKDGRLKLAMTEKGKTGFILCSSDGDKLIADLGGNKKPFERAFKVKSKAGY